MGVRAPSRLSRLRNRCRAGLRLGLVAKFKGILGLEGPGLMGRGWADRLGLVSAQTESKTRVWLCPAIDGTLQSPGTPTLMSAFGGGGISPQGAGLR